MIGRVYKIIVSCSNEIYIGSTLQECRARWQEHKQQYKYWLNKNKPSRTEINRGVPTSFELFEKWGIENCKIILIKEYEVIDKRHLEMYEQLWINRLRPINKNNPFCIQRFYNRDRYVKYLQQNPNYCKEQYQRRLQQNPNHLKEHYQKQLERNPNFNKKQYQRLLQRNPDYHKKQYQKNLQNNHNHNKEKYKKELERNPDRGKEKILCECGLEVNKNSHARHKRTKKHTDRLNN